MKHWCIKYIRQTESGEEIKHYFLFALSKEDAEQRFLQLTELDERAIISVYEIGEDYKEWDY